MPPRLRTLPERHGGRVVLGLLIAILALGLALRVQAALTPPADVGNDAAAYMAIAKGLYVAAATTAGAAQSNPNDWSPGAPLLYGAVYFLTGGVHVKAALLLVALLGTATILLTYLLARRLAGPVAGLVAALLAATYPAFIENNGRLLAEPVALFWLPAAMLAFLWASDGGRLVALARARRAARPDHAHAARVPAVRGAVRAARARPRLARSPAPACWPGLAAALLLVVAFCGVLAPWTVRNYMALDRFVPVTTGGGKALFVATYLPGDGRQQLVKRQLIARYYGKKDLPYIAGPRHGDGAAAQPRREEVPGPRPRRRAGPDRARELQEVRDRAAARLRLDGDPQDPEHVGPRLVGRRCRRSSGSPTTRCWCSGRSRR